MTCVECGAEMATATVCRECGAPAAARLGEVPAVSVSDGRRRWPVARILGVTFVVILNAVALLIGSGFVGAYVTEGSKAQLGADYIPLWATIFMATLCASVPAITLGWVGYRWRRARARRMGVPDTPALPPGYVTIGKGHGAFLRANDQGLAAIRVTGPDFRTYAVRSALVAALVLFGCVLPYPPIIAENAYPKPHVPGWAADAYWVVLAASILALVWALARPRHMGVRLDDRGVKVSNYFRTYRLRWAQVSHFADGCATCLDLNHGAVRRGWALTVMLRDGRGLTATATMAQSGSSEILMAVEKTAQRHDVTAQLTGVSSGRPRAWLDGASETRRQAARYTAWRGATAVAFGGTAVLGLWGATHHGNYYLSVLGGLVALGSLSMTRWARKERDNFRGRL